VSLQSARLTVLQRNVTATATHRVMLPWVSPSVIRIVTAGAAAQDGTISMESAPDVISGAHDLLLSAACSAIHRQRVFRSRRNDLAVEFVKNLTLRCQCAACDTRSHKMSDAKSIQISA
jgi:hypothetical protein